MIKRRYFYTALLFLALTTSCKEKSANKETNAMGESLKNVSELTYQDIFYLLHKEEEYGIDFHGDSFGQEATDQVALVTTSASDCGDAMVLRSSSAKDTIQAVVKTTFSFPNNPANEIVRIYYVNPEETVPVGHTKLCYNGEEYAINREVVSAGFTHKE